MRVCLFGGGSVALVVAVLVGEEEDEEDFQHMMVSVQEACPCNGRNERTGTFDFTDYCERHKTTTGLQTWAEGEWMTKGRYVKLLDDQPGPTLELATQY